MELDGQDRPAVSGDPTFLEAADRIGHQLCRDALWHGQRCTWAGWSIGAVDGTYPPVYRTTPATLYEGVAGIAVFLGQLAQRVPTPRLKATIVGAARQMLARAPELDTPPQRGFYAGTLGIAYALSVLGETLSDEALLQTALDLAARGIAEPFADDALDMIGGCAGAISVLIGLGRRYKRDDLLGAALPHAQQLLKAGVADERGLSWPTLIPRHGNLLGYAHGNAGMATALLEAHAAFGEDALLAGANEALRYERSWFDAVQQGWPDLRIDTTAGPQAASLPLMCNATWCSGATGIGFSRLRLLALLPDQTHALEDVNIALQAASRIMTAPVSPTHGDFCLCHGLAGVADFVLAAGEQLERDDITKVAEEAGRFMVEHYLRPGLPLPCGVEQRGEAPGLLLGIAGIGYFFLRLYARGTLPSVLLMTP